MIEDHPLAPSSQHQIASNRREPDDLAYSTMNNRGILREAIISSLGLGPALLKTRERPV
jgi:hypothetical protein